jgi:hypothetical protein
VDWLLTREACITFAVAGAVLSTAASILQAKKVLSARNAQLVNYAGYGAMGVSILVFIVAGFRSPV